MDAWEQMRARPTAAARCSRSLTINLWRGYTLLSPRRPAGGRGVAARGGRGASRATATASERNELPGGAPGARPCSSAATSPGRARRSRPRREVRRQGRRRHASGAGDRPRCCSTRASSRRRSRPVDELPRRACGSSTRPTPPGARCKARGARPPRPHRRGDRARRARSSSWRAQWGAPATRRPRAAGRWARSSARTGSSTWREAVELLERLHDHGCSYAKALCALGHRAAARAPADRGPRAARTGARAGRPSAAPAPLAERARSELHATGARPRRDGAQRRRLADPVREAGRRPRRRRACRTARSPRSST